MTDYVYDLEVYPNVFTATFYNPETETCWVFEISERVNGRRELVRFLREMKDKGNRLVGFNNWFFDYPILHHFLEYVRPTMTAAEITRTIYAKCMAIIKTPFENRWKHVIYDNQQHIQQIDLYRIHHFDNKARSTSLKLLEFNMHMESIQELPFPPGTVLTPDQIDTLIEYNQHDVAATARFFDISRPQIAFREELTRTLDRNFLNHNDTKIGKDYFVMRLQQEGVVCFDPETRAPIQTQRNEIVLKDIIFDYIEFERPEFNAVLNWFRARKIRNTKAVFTEIKPERIGPELERYCDMSGPKGTVKNLNCIVDGVRFDFGTGGIHGSIESAIIESDETHCIIDIDVTSLYPSIAIENGVYPAHLGSKFVDIYRDMKHQRLTYKKGTPENAMLKLALNGVYGDSNNRYSPFFDPQYTMTITINGQLMLCMLAEKVMKVPDLELIQINTDGITMRLPRDRVEDLRAVMFDWELLTGLELEEVEYSRMCIRDVNNYIGVYTTGKVKRKGAYEYDVQWHQNHSSLVVPKAAEAALIYGKDIQDFVMNHEDTYDFFLRTKVPRNSRLQYEDEFGLDVEVLSNITRYYIATEGKYLVKVMPPLRPSTKKERRISINKGQTVKVCNDTTEIDRGLLDYKWYIEEAKKMVEPLYA